MIEIPPERREHLTQTLREHQSNLVSLVVRRTQAYDEEKEYEMVYGADWCIVAQELEIERLWVWVFDLTDEQAMAMKAEMEQLLGVSIPASFSEVQTPDEQPLELQLKQQIRELKALQIKDHQEVNVKFQTLLSENAQMNQRLKQLENTLNHLTANFEQLTQLLENSTKTSSVLYQTVDSGYRSLTVPQLKESARKRHLKVTSKMRKNELINAILATE